jgi:hypothetical protein
VTERRQPASNPQEATMATTLSTWTIDPERGATRYQASQTRLRV